MRSRQGFTRSKFVGISAFGSLEPLADQLPQFLVSAEIPPHAHDGIGFAEPLLLPQMQTKGRSRFGLAGQTKFIARLFGYHLNVGLAEAVLKFGGRLRDGARYDFLGAASDDGASDHGHQQNAAARPTQATAHGRVLHFD